MKKSSKSSLKKKKGLLIYLSNIKNKASYKFSKKNFCLWPVLGLTLKGLIDEVEHQVVAVKTRLPRDSPSKATNANSNCSC